MDEEQEVEEKEQKHHRSYFVGDATSFEQLERTRGAHEAASEVAVLTEDFHALVDNIVTDKTIDDTTGAINFITNEFTRRIEDSFGRNVQQKEGSVIDKIIALLKGEKGAQFKRENGLDFPSTDYAFVPDASKPSTWKLRLTERPGNVTVAQLGRAAAALSSGGFRGNKVKLPSNTLSAVKRRIRTEYLKLGVAEGKLPASVRKSFSVWKDKEGKLRWDTIYSNNYLDDDNPPDIITAKSHENFVEMVNDGTVDYPEIWHWHVPGTAWGKADFVDFVDGFAFASGYVYEGHEKEAEILGDMDNIKVSHGMPNDLIVRDSKEKRNIVFHVTTEISPLLGNVAANPYTSFAVLKETQNMSFSEEKRQHFLAIFDGDEDKVAELDERLSELKGQAEDEGRDSKESEDVETEVLEGEEEDTPSADAEETTDEVQNDFASREEIAETLAGVIEPVAKTLQNLSERLASMEAVVKELQVSDEAKVAKQTEETPKASLADILSKMVIGHDEARVDGRKSLAKDGPQEAEDKDRVPQTTPVPMVNSLIASNRE